WLIASLLILLALNRWIAAHVQGVGLLISNSRVTAVWFYFFLFLPGILIHELSHYLTARLLGVKVSRFSLWPGVKRGGELVLGSVQVRGAGPVRHSLVGVAPLLFGSLAVLLIGRLLRFDALGQAAAGGSLQRLLDAALESLTTPDFWLWLYLLFAIANAMLPSESDRLYWTPVLIFVAAIAGVGVGLDMIPAIPPNVQTYAVNFVTFLASAFSIAVAVDLLFVIVITLLEAALAVTTGRKVQY
ncbi:MAG: hypothetical protein ACE5G8_07635, partial [Anaerolineae bacterium]